jgi:chitinase
LTGTITPTSLTLAPGASGSATLTVTSAAGSAGGSYTVSAGTVGDTSRAATANATYWIDSTPPSAPTGLRASLKSGRVTLSWSAASDTGGSGVARYEVRRNGAVAGSTASTTYTDSPGSGAFTYTVVAIDGAGNQSSPSAGVPVTVAVKARRK